jgi:hypothetical protein
MYGQNRPLRVARFNLRSSTFTGVSSVPTTFELSTNCFKRTYRGSSNWADCRIQPPMVWSGISTPKRLKIFAWRCTGRWSAILLTITCASSDAPATLFSMGCGGLPAVFTVHAHAYFLQTSSITSNCAGMYS